MKRNHSSIVDITNSVCKMRIIDETKHKQIEKEYRKMIMKNMELNEKINNLADLVFIQKSQINELVMRVSELENNQNCTCNDDNNNIKSYIN